MIPALIVFVITYVLMLAFQKYRPYIALTSALVFVAMGYAGLFPAHRRALHARCGPHRLRLHLAGLGHLILLLFEKLRKKTIRSFVFYVSGYGGRGCSPFVLLRS